MYKALYQGRAIVLKLAGELNLDVTERQKKDAAKELRILSRLRHECVVTVRTAYPAVHADSLCLVACMRPAEEISSKPVHSSAAAVHKQIWPPSCNLYCHVALSGCDVQLIGASFFQGQLGILMELMSQDLFSAMAAKAVSWNPVGLRIAVDIAAGLTYLHSQNVIHNDIKSCNIVIQRPDMADPGQPLRAKIADVGLCRFITGTQLTTADQGPRYTFNWASPEQIMCKPLTPALVVFSLGVSLACHLHGHLLHIRLAAC